MNNPNKKINEFLELLGNLHYAADEFERSGLKPIDLIKSTDASKEAEIHDALGIKDYNFDQMTWGEACNFILNYSDYYSDNLKKLRIVPISKLHH
jgi:hypothetical protein